MVGEWPMRAGESASNFQGEEVTLLGEDQMALVFSGLKEWGC
jgi:hypothetical protein